MKVEVMYFDVFISYSSKDKDIVKKIAEALSNEFYVFFDIDNITIGDNIENVIKAGLGHSKFGLIIFSKNFFRDFNVSLKKIESTHFISKLVNDDKILFPIWLDIDRNYLERKIKQYTLDPRLLDIKAIIINETNPLEIQINQIIAEINKNPRKTGAFRRTIKKEQLNAITLNPSDFPSNDWQKQTPKIVSDSEKIQIWETYINIKTGQHIDSIIHLFNTISLAKKSFDYNKKLYGCKQIDKRLFSPKIGEEQYGYNNGVEVATFRTSNILATHCYYFTDNPQSIKKAEKYSKIVDRNIRILLGKRE
jgi:hypothetical protein